MPLGPLEGGAVKAPAKPGAGVVTSRYKGPRPGERVERPWWGPRRACGHWVYVEDCGVCVGLFQEEVMVRIEKMWGSGPPYEMRECGHWVADPECRVCREDVGRTEETLERLGMMGVAEEGG